MEAAEVERRDGERARARPEGSHLGATVSGWLMAAGLMLVLCLLGVTLLSHRFVYGTEVRERPIVLMVGLLTAAGVAYVAGWWAVRRTPCARHTLIWILVVGGVARGLFLFSTPICETDFYRYLWDGAVTAHGLNPYAHAPGDVLSDDAGEGDYGGWLGALAASSGGVIDRVNHPRLGSIYPPVAQGAFALAYRLRPWSVGALRAVMLLFDTATLLVLLALLRHAGLPLTCALVYWWNPVLIKETVNSAHMDVIALPFALGAVLLAAKGRHTRAAAALALAVGAKIWPVILLPLVLRGALRFPRRFFAALLVFGLVLGVLMLPVAATLRLGGDSGFIAYGREWEMNDALFMAVRKAIVSSLGVLGVALDGAQSGLAARAATAALLALVALGAVWRPAANTRDLCGRALLVVAALFLLSPTQFPWYFVWVIPFLALRPRLSLLFFAVLLPLYYLRFHFDARDQVGLFDNGIVWIEFAPVWALLLVEWYRERCARDGASREEAVSNA